MRLFLFSAMLFVSLSFAAPGWFGGSPSSASSGENPKVVTKTVRDTLRVVDTVYVPKVDTVIDTVFHWNARYKYVIRYALTSLNVDLSNPEWLDHSSVSEIIARDTATLKIGSEELRTLGSVIDQFGNKIPQTDVIVAGFTIQVQGDKAVIEYRGKNSLAMFSGNFDDSGFLVATGEIAESGFLASLFPFSLFLGVQKKRIIIEIVREAYL